MIRANSHLLLLGAVALLQACVAEPPVRDGSLECEGLTRVSAVGLGGVCVLSSAAGSYRGALLDEIEYGFHPVASASSSTMVGQAARTGYPVGPQQKAELKSLAHVAFTDALETLSLVGATESASGVLRVRGQILDVLLETPVDPESGAKYLFDTIGRATLVVELYDSDTGVLLLRSFDHRETQPLSGDGSDPAHSQMAAIAALWRAVLIESMSHMPSP
jgi:hypothetical protein